jgi:hypothetical protein
VQPLPAEACRSPRVWPEVVNKRAYSFKSDICVYGVLLWEILTGLVPCEGKQAGRIAYAIAQKRALLPIPADAPPGVALLIEVCWEHRREWRPSFAQTITEFCQDLIGTKSSEVVARHLAESP